MDERSNSSDTIMAINDDLKEVTVDGEPVKLTPIEYSILLLLVKHQGKVFSIDQIYENIWNENEMCIRDSWYSHCRSISDTNSTNLPVDTKDHFHSDH